MEDNGYLLSHPLIYNLNIIPIKQHITHKESYIANDILNHKHFVKKKICTNYLNRTIQRFVLLTSFCCVFFSFFVIF